MVTKQDKPYAVEYYYKARWGYADEFIRLFKKNHYPVLKKQIELGRISKNLGYKTTLSCNRRRTLGLQSHLNLEKCARDE